MAARDGFRVDGLNSVVRALTALGLEVDDLKEAFAAIAAEGREVVASFVPRLSGALAGDVRGNRAQRKAVVTVGRVSLPYAGAINYGWPAHGIEAVEFMQRGDQVMRSRALQRLEGEVNRRIREKNIR